MSVEKIIGEWAKAKYKSVYWLEGEEEYYIDQVAYYAEHNILSKADAEFNKTIFYGKDADFNAVLNACRRYPMFAERQVVLIKEAQHMKDIEKLEGYLNAPLDTTVLVVCYKGKNVDKRTKLYKTIQSKAEVLSTKKIPEGKLQQWIIEMVQAKGFSIQPKCAALIEEHIGNDLSRIANEIDKLSVNLKNSTVIDEYVIENYIGISKEYNVFELQAAIAKKDLGGCLKIVQYFEANPKAGAIQMVLPALYSYFSKVYAAFGMKDTSDAALKPMFYFNPISLQQAKHSMKNYGFEGVQKLLLLLHHYDLKSKGVGDSGTSGAILMKEMVTKIIVA
jgi:DNA polymerase III subunit delta